MAPLDERGATRRLLDRFGFGPRPNQLVVAVQRGFDATLNDLLAPTTDSGQPPDLGAEPVKAAKGDKAAKTRYETALRAQEATLETWWLDRMVTVDVATTERLTWFWHGHFATSEQKVRSARLMLKQNETFRSLGMGTFGPLARAMITDPALLVWLDGPQNKIGAANENLGREFLELFTVGIGHYSETDIREAARALTGWTVDKNTVTAKLAPKRHDAGSKTILGSTSNFDAQSFVDLVLARPETARFVSSRLWARLVSATPPSPAIVDKLVAGYGQTGDIRGVLRAIAADPAFRDSATTLVKQPVEWLAGLMRAVGLRPSTLPPDAGKQLMAGLRGMGQVPFLPPSVGGWPSGPAWLSTSAGLARLHLAQLVTDHADLSTVNAAATAARPDAAATLLGIGAWSDRTRSALAAVAGDPKQLLAVAACSPEYVVSS